MKALAGVSFEEKYYYSNICWGFISTREVRVNAARENLDPQKAGKRNHDLKFSSSIYFRA